MVGTPSSKEGAGFSGPGPERFRQHLETSGNIGRMKSCADPRGRNHLGYRKGLESQRINCEMKQTAHSLHPARGHPHPPAAQPWPLLGASAFGAEAGAAAAGSEAAPLYQPPPASEKAATDNCRFMPIAAPQAGQA